jgi:DnaJ family protein A protein 2
MMGGGMMGGMGGGRRRPQRRKGEDMVHPLRVTLEDLFNGKLSKLKLKKKIICAACKGAGGKSGAVQQCTGCNGQGIKISIQPLGPGMVQQVQRVCPDCGGEGEQIDPKNRCKKCNGKKVCEDTKILEVQVDKGMKDNQKITFRGEGDQQPGVEPGDVIIILQMSEDEKFTRKGDDLYYTMDIGLTEALCGFKIPLQQLDKRELLITNAPGKIIEPGCTRCIIGEGMPTHRNPFERGNLFIKFNVRFPADIESDEEVLKKLEALLPPRPNIMIVDDDSTITMTLHDYTGTSGGGDNHGEDDDDDHHGHAHGQAGPGVQCATQ